MNITILKMPPSKSWEASRTLRYITARDQNIIDNGVYASVDAARDAITSAIDKGELKP